MNTEQKDAITKLEAIAKLPEKWRNDMEYPTFGPIFAQFLEQALGALPVEPVPEVPADKWAKEKAAHAQGRRIQHRFLRKGRWSDWFSCDAPEWLTRDDDEYRIAPDTAPAGKLTDEQLCAIATASLKQTDPLSSCEERLLTMVIAVREAVEKEQADRFAAINAVANDRMEEIARLTAELSNATKEWHAERDRADEKIRQWVEANAELERLRWRPVSVKPTEADADSAGRITTTSERGEAWLVPWHTNLEGTLAIHWRPFRPPPAPTTEEKERAEFEAAWQQVQNPKPSEVWDGESAKNTAWQVWQARASKEVKA